MTSDRDMTVEQWLAIRKKEGLKIDPATAEVDWNFADDFDPYGVEPQNRYGSVSRQYFARRPGSDIWVAFDDLPEKTLKALRGRMRAALG